MYFKSLSKYECCACTACVHACPKRCIHLEPDKEGFYYPQIDKDKCINCGKCESVCPVEHPVYKNAITPNVYASYVRDVEERKKSSSGGLFYAIAVWILEQNGIVYGATIDERSQVYHMGVEKKEELYKLRGSKYVQSSLNDTFVNIKRNLLNDRWCYFVGTPCQVAGLKSFLHKEYDKLLTSDLVCHGVPSQWLFDQHISYLEEKEGGKVSGYQFRNNEKWGVCEIYNLTRAKGRVKTVRRPYVLGPYLYSFMYAMTYRYSCYDCKFARIPRQGDITLADFWGVKNYFSDMKITNGVSLILSNTDKGDRLLKQIENSVELRKSNIEEGARYNCNLVAISKKHVNREVVYATVRNEGYVKAASTLLKPPHSLRDDVKYIFLQNRVVSYLFEMIKSIV